MSKEWQYITVAKPDRGLDKSQSPVEISPRNCSDCKNVFFEYGIIKKRFGYGSNQESYHHVTHHATLGALADALEITHIAEHQAIGTSSFLTEPDLYACNLRDIFKFISSSSTWGMCTGTPFQDTDGTDATASDGHGAVTFTTGGGSADDLRVSWWNKLGSGFSLRVEISTKGAPDKFIWSNDGGTNWLQAGGSFGAKGTALEIDCLQTGVNVTFLNGDPGGSDYCLVAFDTVTNAHEVGDRWDTDFDYAGNTGSTSAVTPIAGDGFFFRKLDLVRVKGKNEPVAIYELISEEVDSDLKKTLVEPYKNALELYHSGNFTAAFRAFETLQNEHSEDGPSKLFTERCSLFIEEPPAEDWEGVWTFKTK